MLFVATWMDLVIIIVSEVNQTEKNKYDMVSLIGRILNDTQKQTQRHKKKKLTKKEKMGREINYKFGSKYIHYYTWKR